VFRLRAAIAVMGPPGSGNSMFEALDPCGLTLVNRIEIVVALLVTVIESVIDSVQGENEERQEQFAFVTVRQPRGQARSRNYRQRAPMTILSRLALVTATRWPQE
jgi:hypothetical protein